MKTFQKAALNYLENQSQRIKKSSYETYSQWISNHLIPYFGSIECQAIKKKTSKTLSIKWQTVAD